jgi:hypothetical protein
LRTSARDAPLPINNSKLRASIGNSLICLQAVDLYGYYLFSGTHYTDHAHLIGALCFMPHFFGAQRSSFGRARRQNYRIDSARVCGKVRAPRHPTQ